MSSRLNPRDYDLGELRDAVRESARHHDGEGGGRGADGRRVGHRDDRRIEDASHDAGTETDLSINGASPVDAQPSARGSPKSNGSSDGASSDDTPPSRGGIETDDDPSTTQAAEGGYREDERPNQEGQRTAGRPSHGPSSDRRASQRAGTSRSAERGPSVGRMRRTRRRFELSTSRDRTPDGTPRRRADAGAEDGRANDAGAEDARSESEPEWRPGGRNVRAERAGRSDQSDAAAPSHRSLGTRDGGFELLSGTSNGDVERPYLDRLPQGYRAQVEIFGWLEDLLATCGRDSTFEALEYYEDVGWLSEKSRASLEDFVDGLTAAEPPDPRPLDVDDHRASLRYVARLARRVDR